MATLEIRKLTKAFGSQRVIENFDLNIADGEFVALVGPSGCGKSTLLRIIAGLEDVTTGQICIDGKVVNDLEPRHRNIAMVFQSYALYPHMTVAQNIGFNLKLAGFTKTEIYRRVSEAARMLGLTDLLQRRPAQLSGGQRQRVAMGRAIVRKPTVFLFDEPLSNLDAQLRVQMRSEIKLLHGSVKATSVYVTHDQVEAMTLADRIVVLNKGVLEQQGSPLDLYTCPANVFVAGFIGSPAMNFVPARAIISDGQPSARLADGTLLSLASGVRISPDQALTLGLRPEHITPKPMPKNVLRGQIKLVEPTGAQTYVIFELAGRPVTASLEGSAKIEQSAFFEGTIDPVKIQVFDQSTGLSLRAY